MKKKHKNKLKEKLGSQVAKSLSEVMNLILELGKKGQKMKLNEKTKVRIIAGSISVFSFIGGAFLLSSMLNGCEAKPKTMEYYKDHLDEAKTVIAECKAAGTLTGDKKENCVNASGAILRFGGIKPIRGNEPHIRTW